MIAILIMEDKLIVWVVQLVVEREGGSKPEIFKTKEAAEQYIKNEIAAQMNIPKNWNYQQTEDYEDLITWTMGKTVNEKWLRSGTSYTAYTKEVK